MIKSWKHKGLKRFYLTNDKSGIIVDHAKRLKIVLQLLDAASSSNQMNLPGFDFHKLKGNLEDYYSVAVRANWKIIFQFEGEDALLVDYVDYH